MIFSARASTPRATRPSRSFLSTSYSPHRTDAKRPPHSVRRASIVFGCFLVLHTMHGHCNHTGKIRSAADSQNAQHNSFLRFESYAAFSQRLISLYSLHYTHPRGKFNRFVQFAFPVFIYFAQSTSSFMNCRKVFLQFILHFCNCIPCFGILQKCRSSVKKKHIFLQVFRRSTPGAVSRMHAILHIFQMLRHFEHWNLQKPAKVQKDFRRFCQFPVKNL